MKASELISVVRDDYSQLSLKPSNDDSAIIVEKKNERVFYFSIPYELSDEEIKKQLTEYFSIDWRRRKTGFSATIDGEETVIGSKFPQSGLQVRATI